jgi:hypothetical protein
MDTNAILHVALTPSNEAASWSWDRLKTIAETLALFFTAVFFCYKFISGYFFVNLSLYIECSRKRSAFPNTDYLTVNVKLKKGERGSLRIHDAQVRVSLGSGTNKLAPILPPGFDRSSYRTEFVGKFDKKMINWDKQSKASPILRIAPGEETTSACVVKVPSDEICIVEVAVQGRRGVPALERHQHVGQWKAATVSLPL